MSKYDISVIVPMYNAERYIGQCLESVLNQTKDNIQVVVVNDGSTDGSQEIVKNYAKKYENIVCVEKKNGGLASARIAGLQNSNGNYIGWVDADDFIEPKMFEVLYKLIIDNEADLVYCKQVFYPKKPPNKEIWFKEYKGVKDWNFIERNCQPSHFCASSELLKSVDICSKFREFGEYGWISVMLNANKIAYTDECLYYYRVGHQSMSGGSYKGKVQKFIDGAETSSRLKSMLEGTNYQDSLASYFDYRYIYALLLLEIVSAKNKEHNAYLEANQKLKEVHFRDNPYTKSILDENYGRIKSFFVRNVIPQSYQFAMFVTNLLFR